MKIYPFKVLITLLITTFLVSPAWAQQGSAKNKKERIVVNGRDIGNAISSAACEAGKAIAKAVSDVKVIVVQNGNDADTDLEINVQSPATPQAPQEPQQNGSGRTSVNQDNNPYKRTKKYSKSYPLSSSDQLAITNSFGKVEVIGWNKNEVKVDVEMLVSSTIESRADALIAEMNVSSAKTGNLVSFKTNFGHVEASGDGVWSSLKKVFTGTGNYSQRMQVNYTVYMPVENALTLKNSYGSIILPDFEGNTTISSAYGTINAKSLKGAVNKVSVSYGKARIGSANNLNMNVSYSPGSYIESLSGTTRLNVAYSPNLKVLTVSKNARDIAVNAEYSSNLVLGFDEGCNLDYSVKVTYDGFKYNKAKLEPTETSSGKSAGHYSPTKMYRGQIGRGGNGNIVINATYGSVSFL